MVTSAQRQASRERRAHHRTRGKQPGRRVRARPILPGVRYKVTRRCYERRFYLVPDDPRVRNIIGYCLGLACARYGIHLHAAVFMSNHYHLEITDTQGRLPQFKTMFNAFLARSLNALRGRFDGIWSEDRPCDVQLCTDKDVIEGMAYTLTNPTTAGLVKHGGRWPGFTTYGMAFGETLRFHRPKIFFDATNASRLPDVVEIRIERPDIAPNLSDEQLFECIMQRAREVEREKQRKLRAAHARPLGERKVCKQHWRSRPRTFEPRFTKTPRVSSSNKWARIAQLQRNHAWEDAYRDAYDSHLRGEKVRFPPGTYWMRLHAGVTVAERLN